jgi:hypothetical protein
MRPATTSEGGAGRVQIDALIVRERNGAALTASQKDKVQRRAAVLAQARRVDDERRAAAQAPAAEAHVAREVETGADAYEEMSSLEAELAGWPGSAGNVSAAAGASRGAAMPWSGPAGWAHLGLHPALGPALERAGFHSPTAIQNLSIGVAPTLPCLSRRV